MNNVMLDLETLGNTPNSVIIAIGAVKFDREGLGSEFYAVIDAESCIHIGLTMDTSTVMWWLKQSNEARAAFDRNGTPIMSALNDFREFCSVDDKMWGNGAAFDNVILSNAYRKALSIPPWQFYNDRCYRTLKALHPQVAMVRSGTHHNALDDAKSQAEHLITIVNSAGIML